MNLIKKTSAALVASALSVTAFAGSDMETRLHELERKMDMASTTTAADTFGAKTALARTEPNGKGWFLSLDVLYWQTKVDDAAYAQETPIYSAAINDVTTNLTPKFQWSFAFKAGLGYNFCHDGWDSHAEYTYFRNNASDSTSVSTPSAIFPLNGGFYITSSDEGSKTTGSSPQFALSSVGSMRLSLNDLILDLGRSFFVSKNLSLRPNMGLKASWITITYASRFTGGGVGYTVTKFGQTVTATGLGSNTVYISEKDRFFGLGPRAGIDTKWYLGNDISIYGDVSGALLFGYFRNQYQETYSALPANLIASHNRWHALTPTVDFELGLVYDRYIMCDTQHFSISLGYETQYYWNVGAGMYGVNLKARWDF